MVNPLNSYIVIAITEHSDLILIDFKGNIQ